MDATRLSLSLKIDFMKDHISDISLVNTEGLNRSIQRCLYFDFNLNSML